MISMHPDQHHINGLLTMMDQVTVDEDMVHDPHEHGVDAKGSGSIAAVDGIVAMAENKGITVAIDPGAAETMLAELTMAANQLGVDREAAPWRSLILIRTGAVEAGKAALAEPFGEPPAQRGFNNGLVQVGILSELHREVT